MEPVRIIGGGLAGSEAAFQLAVRGVPVVLHEMRPVRRTPAHKTEKLAELVCSNSFRSDDSVMNAVGLLHYEMRRLNSLVMRAADTNQVPAGGALAVDREGFSAAVTAALERNGFFGPDSWYMNHDRNIAYAAKAVNGGRLSMPVLFLHGAHDLTCDTTGSRLAEPMREYCADLTEVVVQSGHWMAQECPVAVNAALAKWLATKLGGVWADAIVISKRVQHSNVMHFISSPQKTIFDGVVRDIFTLAVLTGNGSGQ